MDEGIRFHVRRCIDLLFDIRNKRDVAHLGSDVDVKEMDAQLVMRLSSWAVAEVVRVESGMPASEVQEIVDRLAASQLPLVEGIDDELVVLATDLPAVQRALVALLHTYPAPMDVGDLRHAVQYGNSTRFRAMLAAEAKAARVHRRGDEVRLTRKGAGWVQRNIDLRLRID